MARTVLIKVPRSLRQQVFAQVSKRTRIFACEACSSREERQREEEEEAPLHRLLENPACLSLLAFKDDREVRREIAVAMELPSRANGFLYYPLFPVSILSKKHF